jgi:anti-sigma regulatory factor (Ser/Thr protein kinase)
MAGNGNGAQPVDPGRPPTLDVVVPAVASQLPELRDAARHFAAEHGMDEPERVALAVTEACTSAVLHAAESGTPIALRLTGADEDGRLIYVVTDRVPGPMPPPAAPGLNRLPFIASLSERVSVLLGEDGSRIRIAFAAGHDGHPRAAEGRA